MSDSNTFTITNQDRSKGGKKRAENLTAEQRREIALKANHSRKCMRDLPKATHSGELIIGDSSISCCVLADGRRLISETSMFEILGRTRKGRGKGKRSLDQLPAFLSANNIRTLVINNLGDGPNIIPFINSTGAKMNGYEASLIPNICKIFIDAYDLGILTQPQIPTAIKCKIILHALASVGITALIDEATGYEKFKENNELQKLFQKFIAKELQPWTKKFPNSFFNNIKRMYGLEHLKGNPKFAGHLINKYIYGEINEEILEELKKINPLNCNGNRTHRHHQFLTEDVGHPALTKQILKIDTLMSASENKEEFETLFEKIRQRG